MNDELKPQWQLPDWAVGEKCRLCGCNYIIEAHHDGCSIQRLSRALERLRNTRTPDAADLRQCDMCGQMRQTSEYGEDGQIEACKDCALRGMAERIAHLEDFVSNSGPLYIRTERHEEILAAKDAAVRELVFAARVLKRARKEGKYSTALIVHHVENDLLPALAKVEQLQEQKG